MTTSISEIPEAGENLGHPAGAMKGRLFHATRKTPAAPLNAAPSAQTVREGGKPAHESAGVTFLRMEAGKAVYRLTSGDYDFTAPR